MDVAKFFLPSAVRRSAETDLELVIRRLSAMGYPGLSVSHAAVYICSIEKVDWWSTLVINSLTRIFITGPSLGRMKETWIKASIGLSWLGLDRGCVLYHWGCKPVIITLYHSQNSAKVNEIEADPKNAGLKWSTNISAKRRTGLKW